MIKKTSRDTQFENAGQELVFLSLYLQIRSNFTSCNGIDLLIVLR